MKILEPTRGGKLPFEVEAMTTPETATARAEVTPVRAFAAGLGAADTSPHADPGPAWPEEARRQITAAYGPVVGWVQGRLHLHEDEVQDALHEVLKKLGPRQISRIARWERYLTRAVLRRLKRSKLRHRGKLKILLFSELSKEERESLYAIPAPGRPPDEEAAHRELLDLLRTAVEGLPPRQRQVLTLLMDGKTPADVQAILGLKSLSTVSTNRRKAIANLRRNPVFREDE
jgi:RNA polymerase sigma factor (sigma-70 family)